MRKAEIKDIPAIVELLKEQIPETHLKFAEEGFSSRKTSHLVSYCVQQGFAWVYGEDLLKGVLVAEKRFNMFSYSILEAHVLAVYVKPEFRNGLVAGRLLKTFINKCDEDSIPMIWIGSNVQSALDENTMDKLGFKLQEKFYLKEK